MRIATSFRMMKRALVLGNLFRNPEDEASKCEIAEFEPREEGRPGKGDELHKRTC